MDSVHRLIGVCPQFDTLWETLTPEVQKINFFRLLTIHFFTKRKLCYFIQD